jgi:hypothetical protein
MSTWTRVGDDTGAWAAVTRAGDDPGAWAAVTEEPGGTAAFPYTFPVNWSAEGIALDALNGRRVWAHVGDEGGA